MLNTNLVTHIEQKSRELPLEARHTLSLELSRKRRLSVASSIFIPKDNTQSEPRAKITPDSDKFTTHDLPHKKSPTHLTDKTNLTRVLPKKKLKRIKFVSTGSSYKGQFVLGAHSPLKHPESYPIRKQIVSSDHIRYVAESLREHKVQDILTISMEPSEEHNLASAYEEHNDEEYKSAEDVTEDASNITEERQVVLETPEQNLRGEQKTEEEIRIKNSTAETNKDTRLTEQNSQLSTIGQMVPSSSNDKSQAGITDYSSVTRTENYIITVDASGAHFDIKYATVSSSNDQTNAQQREALESPETQETHSDPEFYTPPLTISISSPINEHESIQPQVVQRDRITTQAPVPCSSIKQTEYCSRSLSDMRNHFRPIPSNGIKVNGHELRTHAEPPNHFRPIPSNVTTANGNNSMSQANLHNHFRPIHNAPVTKARQSTRRLPAEPPANSNGVVEQGQSKFLNSSTNIRLLNRRNRMKLEQDLISSGNVIDLSKDKTIPAPQPINLSRMNAYPEFGRHPIGAMLPPLLAASVEFPHYRPQLAAQCTYTPLATTTTQGLPTIPTSSAFYFNGESNVSLPTNHNAQSPPSRRHQPPITSHNPLWPLPQLSTTQSPPATTALTALPAPRALRRPYGVLDMANVWQPNGNSTTNGDNRNNTDLNMNTLTTAMSRLPLVTPYGQTEVQPTTHQLDLQQRYASLSYSRPAVPSAIWSYPLPTAYTPLCLTPICLPNESMSRFMTEQYQHLRANWTTHAQPATHGSFRARTPSPIRLPSTPTLERTPQRTSQHHQLSLTLDQAYSPMSDPERVGFQPYNSQRNIISSVHQLSNNVWSPPQPQPRRQRQQQPQPQPQPQPHPLQPMPISLQQQQNQLQQQHHQHHHQMHQHINFNGYTFSPNATTRSYTDARPFM